MSLTNFDFPSVSLRQTYAEAPTGLTSNLGVACIGPRYNFHFGDSALEIVNSSSYKWIAGLEARFIDNAATIPTTGGNLDTKTWRLLVKDGVFRYVDVIRRVGDFSYSDTGAADDFSGADANSAASAVAAGFGFKDIDGNLVTLMFGNDTYGQQLVIADGGGWIASKAFGAHSVQVNDYVYLFKDIYDDSDSAVDPNPIRGRVVDLITNDQNAYVGVQLILDSTSAVAGTLAAVGMASFCFTQDYTFVSADGPGVVTDAGALTINGKLTTREKNSLKQPIGILMAGSFYLEIREQTGEGVRELGTVETSSEIVEKLGPVNKDNPLALACYFALAGGQGRTVYFTVVENEESKTDYEDAIDFLDNYTGIYSIVPCSESEGVVQACLAKCEASSNNEESKIRRALWYGVTEDAEIVLERELNGTVAAIDNQTNKWAVTFTDRPFFKHGCRPGTDQLRKTGPGGSELKFTIKSFTGSNSCVVEAVDSATLTAGTAVFSFYRTAPKQADIINNVVGKRCTTSERAVAVWGYKLMFDGEYVGKNYPLAAAAAGMRAYEPCQRPLSNLGYSFFSLSDGFTKSELKQIGANGIWIIANNNDGTPINKRQITTAVANNLNKDEESIIANADTIAMTVINIGQNWVGCSNISPTMLLLLKGTLLRILDSFTIDNTGDPLIGAQLLSYELLRLYQDPFNLDRVYATFNVEPPKPFNKFQMTMRVI